MHVLSISVYLFVQRKKTLLKEYKQRFKNNAIIDKRFGEFDESLSIEDKMLKRYAMEKQVLIFSKLGFL